MRGVDAVVPVGTELAVGHGNATIAPLSGTSFWELQVERTGGQGAAIGGTGGRGAVSLES